MAQVAETEFVTARAEAAKTTGGNAEEVTPEDFHRWLDLARLVAASYGAAEVTAEHWAAAMAMENTRVARAKASAATLPQRAAAPPGRRKSHEQSAAAQGHVRRPQPCCAHSHRPAGLTALGRRSAASP